MSKRGLVLASVGLALGLLGTFAPARSAELPPRMEVRWEAGHAKIGVSGTVGRRHAIQAASLLGDEDGWLTLTNLTLPYSPWVYSDYGSPNRAGQFYRAICLPALTNMAWVPSGAFAMGDAFAEEESSETPVHRVCVTGFYLDKQEVTWALWDEVCQWAMARGYEFANPGAAKGQDHPVHSVNWYDVVKWCNARSEHEGRPPAYYTEASHSTVYRRGQLDLNNDCVRWSAGGYRLPTEAEWEMAARGGLSGKRFPWGDTITQNQANYLSYWENGRPALPYDLNPAQGYHPSYQSGDYPYTSPAGSFAPNGYGLHDLAGNLWEWCWDWCDNYSPAPVSDPHGPAKGWGRILRGGAWGHGANYSRVTARYSHSAADKCMSIGFQSVLPSDQP